MRGETLETYSVKQIAEMLDTNPETVRRWIRDRKLKAVQVSRKDGNVITEIELRRFLKAKPKYLSKIPAIGFATLSCTFAVGGAVVASTVAGYLSEKNTIDSRMRPEDFKDYLMECVRKSRNLIRQKELLITQTKEEIAGLEKQIEQYQRLMEPDEPISKTIAEAMKKTNEED